MCICIIDIHKNITMLIYTNINCIHKCLISQRHNNISILLHWNIQAHFIILMKSIFRFEKLSNIITIHIPIDYCY